MLFYIISTWKGTDFPIHLCAFPQCPEGNEQLRITVIWVLAVLLGTVQWFRRFPHLVTVVADEIVWSVFYRSGNWDLKESECFTSFYVTPEAVLFLFFLSFFFSFLFFFFFFFGGLTGGMWKFLARDQTLATGVTQAAALTTLDP